MNKIERKPSFFINKNLGISTFIDDSFVWSILQLLKETGDKWRRPTYKEYSNFSKGRHSIDNQEKKFNTLNYYFESFSNFLELSLEIKNMSKYSNDEVIKILESKLRDFRTDMLPFGQIVDYQLNDWITKNT